ncbi:CACNG5 [Mytilus coruscus]|uniref:CACNG5 n=1 Tax=Mytilus coruscus TaxID=42192 RepID=A0A6J8A2L4_MYTCO|nr:CACNG5 [Mytilus coruscus]
MGEAILSASFLILAIASLLYIIGVATPSFIKIGEIHNGLWKRCVFVDGKPNCWDIEHYADKDWFKICRGMSIQGLIAILTSTACVALRLFKLPENKILRICSIVATFSTVAFILIGLVLYVKNIDDITDGALFDYGFSFALCILGMCFAALVDIILIYDLLMTKKNIQSCVDVEKK